MDSRNENELARLAVMEDGIEWKCRWRGEKAVTPDAEAPTLKRGQRQSKSVLLGDCKLVLYRSDEVDRDATAYVVGPICQLLAENLTQHPVLGGFPDSDLATKKL